MPSKGTLVYNIYCKIIMKNMLYTILLFLQTISDVQFTVVWEKTTIEKKNPWLLVVLTHIFITVAAALRNIGLIILGNNKFNKSCNKAQPSYLLANCLLQTFVKY